MELIPIIGLILGGLMVLFGCLLFNTVEKPMPMLVIGIALILVSGITGSVMQSTQDYNDCQAAGGHTVHTQGGDGGTICVGPDGRVIE